MANYGIPGINGLGNGLGDGAGGNNNPDGGAGNPADWNPSGGGDDWLSNMMNGGALGDIGSIFSGMSGQAASPFSAAMNEYNKWAQQGANAISPYNTAGQAANTNLQSWADQQKDPSGFINSLMNKYQESPTAKYMQQQALRASQNEASAGGTLGSTPYTLQNQQNAENISQQDQNNWLSNVLGVNTQYGNAENDIANRGEQGANSLLNLYGNEANAMGTAAAGQKEGENQDENSEGGGIGGLVKDGVSAWASAGFPV